MWSVYVTTIDRNFNPIACYGKITIINSMDSCYSLSINFQYKQI